MSESTSEPSSPARKPSTVKPSINEAAKINKNVLITTIKSPKVSMVIGNVSNTKSGRTNTFSKPSTNAAMIAV